MFFFFFLSCHGSTSTKEPPRQATKLEFFQLKHNEQKPNLISHQEEKK
jgi:hypothetical protein